MKTMKIFTYVFMVIALAMTSCTGEDGADGQDGANGIDGTNGTQGADGQDGADGTDGQDGQDGTNGQDGEDGNANVFSSGWIEFDTAVWSDVTSEFGVEYRNYPIAESEITQDIVDNGVVLVFSRFVITGTAVYALPFTENITGADPAGQIVSYRFDPDILTLKMRNVTGAGDPGTFGGPGIAEYRYIVIPASSAGTSPLEDMLDRGVDVNNYIEVMAYYGLN